MGDVSEVVYVFLDVTIGAILHLPQLERAPIYAAPIGTKFGFFKIEKMRHFIFFLFLFFENPTICKIRILRSIRKSGILFDRRFRFFNFNHPFWNSRKHRKSRWAKKNYQPGEVQIIFFIKSEKFVFLETRFPEFLIWHKNRGEIAQVTGQIFQNRFLG